MRRLTFIVLAALILILVFASPAVAYGFDPSPSYYILASFFGAILFIALWIYYDSNK